MLCASLPNTALVQYGPTIGRLTSGLPQLLLFTSPWLHRGSGWLAVRIAHRPARECGLAKFLKVNPLSKVIAHLWKFEAWHNPALERIRAAFIDEREVAAKQTPQFDIAFNFHYAEACF